MVEKTPAECTEEKDMQRETGGQRSGTSMGNDSKLKVSRNSPSLPGPVMPESGRSVVEGLMAANEPAFRCDEPVEGTNYVAKGNIMPVEFEWLTITTVYTRCSNNQL
jgi:hypothetical protein